MSTASACLSDAREDGAYFGYPTCCVEWFTKASPLERMEVALTHGCGTGFVPCPEHHEALRNGTATLASLITDRECPLPFPRDSVMLNTLGTLRLPWVPPYPRATYPRWRRKQ